MKLAFAGTPEFAARHLAALLESPEHEIRCVFTQADRPAGRGRPIVPGAVKRLCVEHALALHQPASLREPASWQPLRDCGAEILVVVAYGRLLPPGMLAATGRGGVNVHASLLPRWRGAAPIQRAIAAGDRETGITIMHMDAGMDTGDILCAARCPIGQRDNSGALEQRLATLGCATLLDALRALEAGTLAPTPQDPSRATLAPKIESAEARLDWRQDAETLARQVRAFNPKPMAFTSLAGVRLRVWTAQPVGDSAASAPGSLLPMRAEGLPVACGRGALCLQSAQWAGGRQRPIAELARAFAQRFAPGQRCGDDG